MTDTFFAHRAAPDRGGCESTRLGGGRVLSNPQFPHTPQDLVAKTALSALFAAGSARRFTNSKRLAATLPQMTPGLSPYGPNPLEVTK